MLALMVIVSRYRQIMGELYPISGKRGGGLVWRKIGHVCIAAM